MLKLVDFVTNGDVVWDQLAPKDHQTIDTYEDTCKQTDQVEWKDCAPDWPDGTTEKNWPVAFARNTKITLQTVTFKVSKDIALGAVTVEGRAALGTPCNNTNAGEIVFTGTATHTANTDLTVTNLTANNPLPNCVTALKPLTIIWTIKYKQANQEKTLQAGSSSHTVFVLYAAPIRTVYLTIADFTSARARGATTEAAVVEGIWQEFRGPTEIPTRAIQPRTLNPVSGQIGRANAYLQYYPSDWTLSKQILGQYAFPTAKNTRDLLRERVGWCYTWADFFAHSLGVHGIRSEIIQIGPRNGLEPANDPRTPIDGSEVIPHAPADAGWMLVKQWTFGPNATGAAAYPYLRTYTIANNQVTYTAREFSYDRKEALPGQNNPNPQALFRNHVIVRYNNRWYDPSYGAGSFADLTAWSRAALSGYATASGDAATGTIRACRLNFPAAGNPTCGR